MQEIWKKIPSIAARADSTARRTAVVTLLVLLPAQAFAVDSALVRSLLIPGLGQAQRGNYTRATLFAGTAVVSGFGLILSQVYYKEAVDKFNQQERIYASYGETLDRGGVVSIADLEGTYAAMQAEHKSADDRLVWRNGFAIVFAVTYAINIVDILTSKPYDVDQERRLSVESDGEGFRVVKTFRF